MSLGTDSGPACMRLCLCGRLWLHKGVEGVHTLRRAGLHRVRAGTDAEIGLVPALSCQRTSSLVTWAALKDLGNVEVGQGHTEHQGSHLAAPCTQPGDEL